MNSLDTSDMLPGLPFGRAPAFVADSPQLLNRAYHFSSLEITVHQLKRSLLIMRFVSSLVSDKSELHITLSKFRLGGKMALQMAYFCLHGQRHRRVSQLCLTYGYVARPCIPWGTL
ncbi:Uncharacterized protein F383_30913 [Gossypium arboreum]|uniref:Uncharacterized protein n=1 Tax=Gossypium arboreum TaxID=29729 RepID=A0A0B0MS99_GOSAR|nr:Uncharacterized protein F383_30913 [Gossypium arboreum]